MQKKRVNNLISVSGFTLVEVLIVVIILGIISAITIPMFAGAGQDAKTSTLAANLQRIRAQINLYKFHHDEKFPLLANFEDVMTQTTDASGNIAGSTFGPYMFNVPKEPFTEDNNVSASGTDGWNYNQITGKFWAPTDPNL
jgi:prepilin-type N-terminal cleavage/methylation domain-containing protein